MGLTVVKKKKKKIVSWPSATYTQARCRCYRSVETLSFGWVATGICTWMGIQREPAYGCVYSSTNPPTAAFFSLLAGVFGQNPAVDGLLLEYTHPYAGPRWMAIQVHILEATHTIDRVTADL